jgi:arsenate reductase (glutaredoxin)
MSMPPFDTPTLLHNPKCSKSRAAKALLDERKFVYHERRYLDEPLSRAELAELAKRLARPAREWVRTGEPAFREACLDGDAADETILTAMERFPVLIERPILVVGKRAAVGRPIERIVELLEAE